ncbi:MAG: hypothetical protein RLZZ64_209 [Bacteroidota bacterium]|jgi:hypothetical protein
MQTKRIAYLCLIMMFIISSSLYAQVDKVKPVIFDGVIHAGYVNNGGYINFSGPSLSIAHKNSKFMFGMLPSLRFKQDKGVTKNATVFPTLGFGLTYGYKFLSFQLPLYYNPKTTTSNGSWHLGFGIGYRINGLNKKN